MSFYPRALSPTPLAFTVLYASTSPASAQAGDTAALCSALNSFTLPVGAITLPTSGAKVTSKMGREKAADFIRFYLVPGLAHGGGRFSPTWDNLTALDNWVENGVPPVNPIVMDATKSDTRGRTRPLCEFPSWQKYTGKGDMSQASSFTCARD